MTLFKMEAIEQELKHLSKKKNQGKRLVGVYSSVLNARYALSILDLHYLVINNLHCSLIYATDIFQGWFEFPH